MLPQTQGAKRLYHTGLKPLFQRIEPKVDVITEKLAQVAAMIYSVYKVREGRRVKSEESGEM